MEFQDLIEKRRSIRTYTNKAVEKEKVDKVLNACFLAPSAGNMQSYKIVIVRDRKMKEALYYATDEQDMVLEAPLVLVFLADQNYCSAKYLERGANLYSIQDATIAAAYAQLAAANLGLGSVWIGAFNETEVSEILKVKKGERPIAIIPLGYPAENPPLHESRPKSELIREF